MLTSSVAKPSLSSLLLDFNVEAPSIFVEGLQLDSRAIKKGDLFFALKGTKTDGRQFIDTAIDQGAVAVLIEPTSEDERIVYFKDIPIIPVPFLAKKISTIASRFYHQPSAHLSVLGVTGTNGKTTTSQFIAQALSMLGVTCGVIGTIGVGLIGKLVSSTHTTPSAIEVQRLLAELLQQGAKAVVMEVSSHGLDQYRVESVNFHTALFTNLTRDHLDYHVTMEAYGAAKEKLFLHPELQRAVINFDDQFGQTLAKKISMQIPTYTYSTLSNDADISAHNIVFDEQGVRATVKTPWGEGALISPLLGRFNLSNLLGVLSVLCSYGYELNKILDVLSQLQSVVGRMQRLGGGAQPLIVIDYAHTPDALKNVLLTLREHCRGKLYCVFGCGGNRDEGKRALMGAISEQYADNIILTNDNPRLEASEIIIGAILSGIKNQDMVAIEPNRQEAIYMAIKKATANDVILIAGKGHEQYQEIGTSKIPFSDFECAKNALHDWGVTP